MRCEDCRGLDHAREGGAYVEICADCMEKRDAVAAELTEIKTKLRELDDKLLGAWHAYDSNMETREQKAWAQGGGHATGVAREWLRELGLIGRDDGD